jgi:hypothetical protein
VFLAAVVCINTGTQAQGEGQAVKMPHYAFEIPMEGNWSVERPDGPFEVAVLTRQPADTSHAPTLERIQIMRNTINKRRLVRLSARENADNIRNIEREVMLEQGVAPGLYQLHDVSMGEQEVSGRRFYFMDYRTETATDIQPSSLYLFFPEERNNKWFIMVHYTVVIPKGNEAAEYPRSALMSVLGSLKFDSN